MLVKKDDFNSKHQSRKAKRIAVLLATSALSFLATSAFAENYSEKEEINAASTNNTEEVSSTRASETVIVQARRRKENVQKVPIAISIIGGAQIDSSGAYRLDQIKQLVPSIQTISFNPRNANVTIRGLGGNVALTNDGLEQGVGFYVDDVYYGRSGQSQYDLVDISQVEVLRGPQGTLFGKNTTAGAISVSTREPNFKKDATIELSGGNLGFAQLKASVSGPIFSDWIAARFTVAATQRDGYIHNVRTNRDLHDYENFTTRLQILAKPTDKIKNKLILDYGLQRQECCLAVWIGKALTRIDGTPIPNNFDARIARIGYAPLVSINPKARLVDADGTARTNMYQWGASNEFNYEAEKVNFTSVTAYRRWFWTPSNDTDATGATVNYQGRIINHQKQFSQEFRIASKGENKLDWVLGAYYFWQGLDGFSTIWFGPDAAQFNLPPVLYPTPARAALAKAALDDYQYKSYSRPETKSLALFGQTVWHVNDKFNLTTGLRYTKEDKIGTFRQEVTRGAPLSSFAVADQPYITQIRNIVGGNASYDTKLNESNLSGLITGTYNISDDAIIYGTYSKGYKSGGLNLTNIPANIPKTVQPEEVNHVELGLKSSWLNKKLTANLSFYRTVIDQYQNNIFDSVNFVQYISNVGSVSATGFEVDLKYYGKHLSTYTSIAHNNGRYESYPNAPPPVEYTGLFPATANFIDLSGSTLPGAPKWSVSLGGEYSFTPTQNNWEGYIGLDANYKSKYFASVNNSIYSVIDGYATANARFGLRNSEKNIDASLWVKNLTDEVYYETYGAGNTGASGLITGLISQPRTYGITLRKKFGS